MPSFTSLPIHVAVPESTPLTFSVNSKLCTIPAKYPREQQASLPKSNKQQCKNRIKFIHIWKFKKPYWNSKLYLHCHIFQSASAQNMGLGRKPAGNTRLEWSAEAICFTTWFQIPSSRSCRGSCKIKINRFCNANHLDLWEDKYKSLTILPAPN
jgi:hypothetical protein